MGKTQGQNIFGDRFANRQRTSILHLEAMEDSQLLVSHMNGDVRCFPLPNRGKKLTMDKTTPSSKPLTYGIRSSYGLQRGTSVT
jgi:hypothetical protein